MGPILRHRLRGAIVLIATLVAPTTGCDSQSGSSDLAIALESPTPGDTVLEGGLLVAMGFARSGVGVLGVDATLLESGRPLSTISCAVESGPAVDVPFRLPLDIPEAVTTTPPDRLTILVVARDNESGVMGREVPVILSRNSDFFPLAVGQQWSFDYEFYWKDQFLQWPFEAGGTLSWQIADVTSDQANPRTCLMKGARTVFTVAERFEGWYRGGYGDVRPDPVQGTRERTFELIQIEDRIFIPETRDPYGFAPTIEAVVDHTPWAEVPVLRHRNTADDEITESFEGWPAVYEFTWTMKRNVGLTYLKYSHRGAGPGSVRMFSLRAP